MKKPEPGPACFTVVDALDGLFRLEKRSPTLRGSVPLRVAQACSPFLEGNAFGFQVTLTQRWRLERGPLGWSLALTADEQSALSSRYARARERLVAAGHLKPGSPWEAVLEKEALFGPPLRRLGRRLRLRLWTGLLLRPDAGVALRLLPTGSRRTHSFQVAERCYSESGGELVPLILDLELASPAASAKVLTLGGELACLAPLPAVTSFAQRLLSDCPEVGRAHAAFYDPSYFQRKNANATRRYRRQMDLSAASASSATSSEIIVAGPTDFEIVREPAGGGEQAHVVFRNLLDFSCRFDGATVALEFDRQALARKGRPLWQNFRTLYGDDFVAGHEGALFYLTKYFTTHPPGEPHFFVKPWAFTRTPPGWSSLVEGYASDGYEVLRGVIATDQFHATPAVFAIHRADEVLPVPAGAPLLRVFALPRSLLRASFRTLPLPLPLSEPAP